MADAGLELHLFLVWEKAAPKFKEILADINRNFKILEVFQIVWSQQYFSSNLSRFFGTNFSPGSLREIECGTGPFFIVLVETHNLQRAPRQTAKGVKEVLISTFDARERYCSWAGRSNRIHTTNSVREADRCLTLLLGQNSKDLRRRIPKTWDGKIKEIRRDLVGANGYANLYELFYTLNNTVRYVVLRNFESFPDTYKTKSHGAINLFTDNYTALGHALGAAPVFRESFRVLHRVKVAGEEVLLNLRHIGDGYYDDKWAEAILNQRVLAQGGYYRPSEEDHFYTLLYHTAIHKQEIAEDDIARLIDLAGLIDLKQVTPELLNKRKNLRTFLNRFLRENGYQYSEPTDFSVFYNHYYIGKTKVSEERAFAYEPSFLSAVSKIIKQAKDRSVDSDEFRTSFLQRVPKVRAEFSWRRHLILKALPFPKNSSVLQLEAGGTGLTRYLAENFKKVILLAADEGSEAAAKERCRRLDNVKIVSNGKSLKRYKLVVIAINPFSFQERDFGKNKVFELMEEGNKHLAKEGVMVLAGPNQFGLKYLMGCKEEIEEDSSTEAEQPLLSKTCYKEKLEDLGLTAQNFIYPYPDHLFPRIFFTEKAIMKNSRAFGYWAGGKGFEDYLGERKNHFQEILTCGEISRDGELGRFANSFLILAAKNKNALPKIPWQVISYAGERRRREAATITRIDSSDRKLKVRKEGQPFEDELFVFDPNFEVPFHEGQTLQVRLFKYISSGQADRFIQALSDYAEFLRATYPSEWSSEVQGFTDAGDLFLTGDALDATPQNLIVEDDFVVISKEWKAKIHLPLSYLIYRALRLTLFLVSPEEIVRSFNLQRKRRRVAANDLILPFVNKILNMDLNQRQIQIFQQFEARLMEFAYGKGDPDQTPSLMELFIQGVEAKQAGDDSRRDQIIEMLDAHYSNEPETAFLKKISSNNLE